jgi:hypothetical protein
LNSAGTPRTLREAIANGLRQHCPNASTKLVDTLESHVMDYLNQKFTTAMLNEKVEKEIEALYQSIKRG